MIRTQFHLALILLATLAPRTQPCFAQTETGQTVSLAADWQTAFDGPQSTRMVFRISRSGEGWRAVGYYVDQQMTRPISIPIVIVQGKQIQFAVSSLNGAFEGRLNDNGTAIEGKWTLRSDAKLGLSTQALTLTRATKNNAWPVPVIQGPPVIDAKLNPTFEVTTVKPHDPDVPGGGWQWRNGRWFKATMSVAGLIEDIYGIQRQQLLNAPDWAFKDVYDYAGVPDLPGWPTKQQRYAMERELLEDRFGLKVHMEKRQLPALVLTVARSGTKLTPSATFDPGVTITGHTGARGGVLLSARNCTMSDLVRLLQQILGKPVVDSTGLDGQYDFDFEFMPDGPGDGPGGHETDDPPPDLTTAIAQNLGLKLGSAKESVDVLVVDRLQRPTPN
jgi:uncharacterized protein (TIGR03435 family)